MASLSSVLPGYSQTPQAGYSPNPSTTDYGTTNHQNWLDTVVSYLTSKWAHGDHNLPLGWNSQQFGMPDPANTPATGTGQLPEVTPATYLAFAKYAQAYKPGMDPALDGVIPYIPPGPQDYVEDPAQVSARVANDHWEQEFGQTKSTADRAAWQQDFANQLSAYGYAQTNNTNANSFAATLFGQNSANTTAANGLAGNIFNTQSGTYNSNENNKLGALQNAGSLAQNLQQMWDARTGKAIDLKANPQDLVAREYATRALQGPQADMVPGYKDVGQYQDIINKLMNWTPGQAPSAPTLGNGLNPYPKAPDYTAMTQAVPTQQSFQTWMAQNGSAAPGQSSPYGGGQPAQPTGGGGSIPGSSMSGNWQPTVAAIPGQGPVAPDAPTYDPNVDPDASGYRWDSKTQAWRAPAHGDAPYKAMAYGGGTDARQFIAGDPQQGGGVNPELVRILNPGPDTKATVTPLNDTPKFAYGTDEGGTQFGRWVGLLAQILGSQVSQAGNDVPEGSFDSRINPSVVLDPSQIDDQRGNSASGRNVPYPQPSSNLPHYAYGTPPVSNDYAYQGYSDPRANKSLASYYGGGQQATPQANPYASSVFKPWAEAHPDGMDHTANVPLYGQPNGGQTYTPNSPMTAPSTAPQTAAQSNVGVTAAGAPQVYLPSYSDTAYQNYPSLQYAQGNMGQPQYNTLATGYAQGAFGAQIPEAGNLNYGHMLDIMNDPDAWGALQSLYRSGNRNLLSAVAAAKSRAPFGQAVNTSLVRT